MYIALPTWKSRYVSTCVGIFMFLAAWVIVVRLVDLINSKFAIFFPGPLQVLKAGLTLMAVESFWRSFALSNMRVLIAWGGACVIAVPLAIVIARRQAGVRVLMPWMDFFRYIPVASVVPISILWLGVGEVQKVAVLTVGTFFQVFVLAVDAVRRVPTDHLDAARTLGVEGSALSMRVLLPAAWPAIFDACRVCVGLTWSYLLVAELVAAESGLGAEIIRAQRFLKTDQIIFVVIILGLLGVAYDRLLSLLRSAAIPWDLRLESDVTHPQ